MKARENCKVRSQFMNKNFNEVLEILPKEILEILKGRDDLSYLQEIRLRANKPLTFQLGEKEVITSYNVSSENIKSLIKRISNFSIYAFEEELRQGYITIKGGHRVGISGSCIIENNSVKTIKNISSINIRICREVIGCGKKLMPFIVKNKSLENTIIISPPKCGKTTLLRDICRIISNGYENIGGKKISLIDERSEIAASYLGVPQLDVGIRTDVYDGCIKSEGVIMAIRALSPDIIICDEIGIEKDMESIVLAMNSGVNVITTIHGYGVEDLFRRKVFLNLIDNKVFKKAIVLSNRRGISTIEYVYDMDSNKVVWGEKNDF